MATEGKSPLLLSGATDSVGNDGRQWAVTAIRYVTKGTDGSAQLLDKAGGREIAFFPAPGANASDTIDLGGEWYDGFYVASQATNAVFYIYYR
jgi:hypothetical protein